MRVSGADENLAMLYSTALHGKYSPPVTRTVTAPSGISVMVSVEIWSALMKMRAEHAAVSLYLHAPTTFSGWSLVVARRRSRTGLSLAIGSAALAAAFAVTAAEPPCVVKTAGHVVSSPLALNVFESAVLVSSM